MKIVKIARNTTHPRLRVKWATHEMRHGDALVRVTYRGPLTFVSVNPQALANYNARTA